MVYLALVEIKPSGKVGDAMAFFNCPLTRVGLAPVLTLLLWVSPQGLVASNLPQPCLSLFQFLSQTAPLHHWQRELRLTPKVTIHAFAEGAEVILARDGHTVNALRSFVFRTAVRRMTQASILLSRRTLSTADKTRSVRTHNGLKALALELLSSTKKGVLTRHRFWELFIKLGSLLGSSPLPPEQLIAYFDLPYRAPNIANKPMSPRELLLWGYVLHYPIQLPLYPQWADGEVRSPLAFAFHDEGHIPLAVKESAFHYLWRTYTTVENRADDALRHKREVPFLEQRGRELLQFYDAVACLPANARKKVETFLLDLFHEQTSLIPIPLQWQHLTFPLDLPLLQAYADFLRHRLSAASLSATPLSELWALTSESEYFDAPTSQWILNWLAQYVPAFHEGASENLTLDLHP